MTASNTDIVLPGALPPPTDHRLGQGTAVEMSRAVAEVHAAMYAAREFPRNEDQAGRDMENSCRRPVVAERAFYRLPRAGQVVTGPTVHLARELARCWGHIQHGVVELRRDPVARQSEVLAFAWDVQTGTRVVNTFIVPHQRDKKDKATGKTMPEDLLALQDIYESNANAGARRLRECIYGVLPPWFTERAKELCRKTNEDGGGVPLGDRVEKAVLAFAGLGVTVEQMEAKLGMLRLRWTGHEIALLTTVYRSLQAHETSLEDEFPPPLLSEAELTAQPVSAAQQGSGRRRSKPQQADRPAAVIQEPSAASADASDTPDPIGPSEEDIRQWNEEDE